MSGITTTRGAGLAKHAALLLSGVACFALSAAWANSPEVGSDTGSINVETVTARKPDNIKLAASEKPAKAAKAKVEAGAADSDEKKSDVGTELGKNNGANRSANPTGAASSLVVSEGATPAANSIRVRGVGANVNTMSVEQDVQVAVDGIVLLRGIERTMSSYADYADLASGAVMYGPQGTMFSKNAIAGAISITTLAPTKNLTGSINLGMGEAGEYHEKGTVSGSLSDTVRARLSAFNNNNPGWIHNKGTGRDDNGSNSWGSNLKTLWNVNDNFDLTFSAWYRNDRTHCCVSVPVQVNSPTLLTLYADNPVVTAPNHTLKNNRYDETNGVEFDSQSMLFSMRGDYRLPGVAITAITAYQSRMVDVSQDKDVMYNVGPVYTGGKSGNFYSDWNDYGNRLRTQQWSQDVRLSSTDASSNLTWVAGFYWYHFDLNQQIHDRIAYCAAGVLGQACAAANTTYTSRQSTANEVNDGYSLFGEMQYALTDSWKLFGGPRVQYEKVQMTGLCFLPMIAHPKDTPYGTCTDGSRMSDDTSVTGDFGSSYDWGLAHFYTRVARGYKGQGFNMDAKTDYKNQVAVAPETNTALEFGASIHSQDNKYTANLVVYQTNFENMQVSASRANATTGSTDTVVTNAGTARSRGFELAMSQKPFAGFSLTENVTFTEAAFNLLGNSCPIQFQAGASSYASMEAAPAGACYKITGGSTVYQNTLNASMPNSPKWKIAVSPRYQFGIPETNYNAFVQAAVNYTTHTNFDLAQNPISVQKAYTIVNSSVGARDKDGKYQLTFSVNNIFNQMYYTNYTWIGLTQSVTNYNTGFNAQIPRNAQRLFSVNFSAKY